MNNNNDLNIVSDYTRNLVDSISADMDKQEEYKNAEIIRLEKETQSNHRIALASLIVAILTLIVALLTLIATVF